MKKTLLSCIFAVLNLMIFSIITEANCIKIPFPSCTPIFIFKTESKQMINPIQLLNSRQVSMNYSYIIEIQVINEDLIQNPYTHSNAGSDKKLTWNLWMHTIKNDLVFQDFGTVSRQFTEIELKPGRSIINNIPTCIFSDHSTSYHSICSQPIAELLKITFSSNSRQHPATSSDFWKQKPFNSVRTLTNFSYKSLIRNNFVANDYTVYKQKSIPVVYFSNFLPVSISTLQGPNSYLASLIIDFRTKT